MSKKNGVPDAWDDADYEDVVDGKKPTPTVAEPAPAPKLTKAERNAQLEESNRRLWQSAENPEPFYVNTGADVPLKTQTKPQVTMLRRQVQGMNLDEDSDEERRKAEEEAAAERTRKAQLEREEKQRKYAEARERLFGSPSPAPESTSSPTKISTTSRNRNSKGPRRRGGGGSRGHDSQQTSSGDVSPARGANHGRQLYDPDYTVKPTSSFIQSREAPANSIEANQKEEKEKPIRNPKGPDGSGRGGFGFTNRGNRTSVH